MDKICVFGDSIAWGYSDYTFGGWVEMLRKHLFQTQYYDVFNLGISGDTVEEVTRRIESETKARMGNAIILAVGINDTFYRGANLTSESNVELFSNQVANLVSLAKKLVPRVFYVGLTSVEDTKVQPFILSETGKSYQNAIIKRYDGVIQRICQKAKIPYIRVFDELGAADLEDGLHPNTKGHRKLFEKIVSELKWK